MGAAHLRPTWCLRSTLSIPQAWKKVQCFCKPDSCLFVVVWVTCKQRPAAQWSGPRRCSCPCAPQACALLPGHIWLKADWRTPFHLQSTPKEAAVSRHTTCSPPDWGLGPYNRALSWGWQMIKLSKSATNLTPWQYIELSELYVILTRKTKYVLRNLRSGGWSPFKTYIIVLGTLQGVSLFTVSLQFKEPLQLHLGTNIMPQTCESSWTPSPLM